jgi:hypothetical protein
MWLLAVWVIVAVLSLELLAQQAIIESSCDFEIFYKVILTTEQDYASLPIGGVSIPYPSNIGVSVKISTDELVLDPTTPQGAILQLEFTWNSTQETLYYDLSNINGAPFYAYGMTLNPSSGASPAFPTCLPVGCAAGTDVCPSVYTVPNGNNTMACGLTDLTLSLCDPLPSFPRIRHIRSKHFHHGFY